MIAFKISPLLFHSLAAINTIVSFGKKAFDSLNFTTQPLPSREDTLYNVSFQKFLSSLHSSAAIHTIASFTKKALDSSGFTTQPSQSVIGAFLFVCRQFYSTSEGLLVLYPYGLHQYVANAWLAVGACLGLFI